MANSSRSFSNLSNRTFSIDLPLDGITVSHHGSASIEIDASFNGANSNGSESSTASFSSSSSRSNSTRSSSTSTTGISSAGSTRHATGNISENSDMDSVEYSVSFEDTQSSPNFSIDISQVEAEIERINRYCSEVVSNISSDTSGSRNSTPRTGRRNFHSVNTTPVEVIDLLNVDDSYRRTAVNRVPEAVIDLCTPHRPNIPTATIDLDDSDIVPTSRRRNHASSSTPTTARAVSVIDDCGPSSPKRKAKAQNVSTDDVYKCPVCLESVRQREPSSTKCGHVFCRQCIQTAISTTHKCPMCNKKLSMRQTTRIYL